jgi:hypothetical protein
MDFKSKAGLLSVTVNHIFKSYFKNDEIVSFNHSRIFEDGTRAELWANGVALEHTYLQSGLTIETHAPNLYESDGKIIFLLDRIQSFPDKTKDNYIKHLAEVRELFGYDNALLIKGNDPICCELFCFYGSRNSASTRSYFINNIAKLEGFISEFKKNHQKLIKQAEENRIVKPWIKKKNWRVELTAKERLIGQYYSRGMLAKDIANELAIKEKTIFNYLESLKDKYLLIDGERDKETLVKKLRIDYELFHD